MVHIEPKRMISMTNLVLFFVVVTICGSSLNAIPEKTHLSRQRRSSNLNPRGKNVCEFQESITEYETKQTKVSSLVKVRVCCSKWITCWKKCTRNRVVTKTITRTISKIVNKKSYHCCDGYTVDSSGTQCGAPICNPWCRNGGVCTAPNKCRCQDGFDGRFCQIDINECNIPGKTNCSQICINLPGTYNCACRKGFIPADPLSQKCKDINECTTNPCKCTGSNCNNVCHNTIGGYICTCGNGYRLSRWNLCSDRNECVEDPDLCPQKCINTPGSYQCTCWAGFRWNSATKKCDEINECSLGNGGCTHNCHNVFGGHVCSCKRGFFLAADRYSCTDFNECNGLTECDSATSTCVNTPGDYYCDCKPGFRYSSNNRTCEDRDECVEKTSLCDHNCANTFGSYRCSCWTGYRLLPDGKTCQDIDECKETRCDQKCINTPGSFRCDCNPGYMLDVDGKTCKPQQCEKIIAPFFGEISCTGYTVGKRCTFTCNSAYHLSGDASRTCNPGGKWSGEQPKCLPNSCNVPRPPPNGKITLPCDMSYGSTCPVFCNAGYVLRGPDLLKCTMINQQVKWSTHEVTCEEIVVCKPNPCKFGGKCQIVSPTKYHCNCSGTGHEGTNCEQGIVSIASLPKLRIGQLSGSITISAKPSSYISISIYPEDNTVQLTPNSLTIRYPQDKAQFRVKGTEGGFKSISYDVQSGNETYKKPSDSLLLVYSDADVSSSTIASLSGLVDNCYQLSIGSQFAYPSCPSRTMKSTFAWTIQSSSLPSTNGVVIVDLGSAKFPVIVPGAGISHVFKYAYQRARFTLQSQPSSPSCTQKTLSKGQFQYIGKSDLFAKEFLQQFSFLTPSWFTVGLKDSLINFSVDNIRAYLWPGSMVKKHKVCSGLAIDPSSLFLVYLHKEHLSLKVHEKTVVLNSRDFFCFAIDICKVEPHVGFPNDSLGHLENLLSFEDIQALGWSLNVKAIGFSKFTPTDSRRCLRRNGRSLSQDRVVLGGASLNYANKHAVKGRVFGDLYLGLKTEGGKQKIDASTECMEGHSDIESPSWKATDLPQRRYQQPEVPSNLIGVTKVSPKPKEDILSVLQRSGSVFRMKSGLRPMLSKTSDALKVDFSYKATQSSSGASGDKNFDKITHLQMLSFAVVDLETAIGSVFILSGPLASKATKLQTELPAWSMQLQTDLNDLMLKVDDTQLINSKVSIHYYKCKSIQSDIKSFISAAKADPSKPVDQATLNSLQKGLTDSSVVMKDLEKSVKVKSGPKEFQTLNVYFNASMCLFKPCVTDVQLQLYPQPKDPTIHKYCYDPSKTPFQMWDVEAVVNSAQSKGHFMKFKTGDKFHLCLAIDGVKRAKFQGSLSILGTQQTADLSMTGRTIHFPKKNINVFGKHIFAVNATVDATLNSWEMLSANVHGKAGLGSSYVIKFQDYLDSFTASQYAKLSRRLNAANEKIVSLEREEGYLRSKRVNDHKTLERARRRYAEAKTKYDNSNLQKQQQLALFQRYRNEYNNLLAAVNAVCKHGICPIECVKVNKCDACQQPVYVNKTLPKCKVEKEERTYSYLSSYKGVCSHIVEDRGLKYTGTCKKPQLESHRAKDIVDRINKKIKENRTLTLEDALELELVNETAGKKLRTAIEKQMFFKSFPRRLQEGILTENDLKKLEEYTNATFADKIRDQLKKIKRAIILRPILEKLNKSQRLTDEDIAKVKSVDPELAKKLHTSEFLKEIQDKIKAGENLTREDMEFLKSINPDYAKNLTDALKRQEKQRAILNDIQRKLQTGKLTKADIDALEKVNPKAAEKLKDALREQLKKKVKEMQGKLNNVKNAIDSGFNNSDFASLSSQLRRLTGSMKPIDKAALEKLQEKLKKANLTTGTVFQETIERIDLALEIVSMTGVSTDLQRTLKAFMSSVSKFDLPKMLQQSQKEILKRLETFQNWFLTAAKIVKQACSNCGASCDKNNVINKITNELKYGLSNFEQTICQSNWKTGFRFADISKLCSSASKIKTYLNRYLVFKIKDCASLSNQVVKTLNTISSMWKGIRNEVPKAFRTQWEHSKELVSAFNSYTTLTNDFIRAFSRLPGTVKLAFLSKSKIVTDISRAVRPGNFTVKQTQFEGMKVIMSELQKAIALIPAEAKRTVSASARFTIQQTDIDKIKSSFSSLLTKFSSYLNDICGNLNSADIQKNIKELSAILNAAKSEMGTLLSSRSVSDLFTASQRLSSIMQLSLQAGDRIRDKQLLSCAKKVSASPFKDLKDFLENVRPLAAKTYKDIVQDIASTLGELESGIKSPVGKLVQLVEQFIADSPKFNIPLMLNLRPKYGKLLLSSVGDYLKIVADIFSKIVHVMDKCPKCKPQDILGKANIKEIGKMLDAQLKFISKGIFKFMSDTKYSPSGLALLVSSLEQARTNLQRIYRSETDITKEGFKAISDSLKTAADAITEIKNGYNDMLNVLAGMKDKSIAQLSQKLSKISKIVKKMYEKSKGAVAGLKEVHGKINHLYHQVNKFAASSQEIAKGPIEQRLGIIREAGNIIKDITRQIPVLFKASLTADASQYLNNDFLSELGKELGDISTIVDSIASSSIKILGSIGVEISSTVTSRLDSINLKQRFDNLRQASSSLKSKLSKQLAVKTRDANNLLQNFVKGVDDVFETVSGKVDEIRAKVMKLREKLGKYGIIYKDFMKTIKELRKGPLPQIGKIKDSVESFADSLRDYDLRKLLTSDPTVLKRKLVEIKQLFNMSATTLSEVDRILRKCNSCNVENILGYRFIKDLARNFEQKFYTLYKNLAQFTNKVVGATGEVQNISSSVMSIKNRFASIVVKGKFNSKTLQDLSTALQASILDVDLLQKSGEDIAKILFNEDVDLQVIRTGYDNLVNQLEGALNKSAEIARKVEPILKDVKQFGKSLQNLESSIKSIKHGPLSARIQTAKDITKGVKALTSSLPKILKSSQTALQSAGIDTAWIQRFGSNIQTLTGSLNELMGKTDSVLNAAGIVVQGKSDITEKLPKVRQSVKNIVNAPWDQKISVAEQAAKDIGGVLDSALDTITSAANALNISFTKDDLIEGLETAIGRERLEKFSAMYKNVTDVLKKLQSGPISHIGKLTDAVEDFVDGLKSYDVGKALLNNPTSLKEKVAQFQQLSDAAADILVNISQISGLCKSCDLDDVLGKGFLGKVSKTIGKNFKAFYNTATKIAGRVKIGYRGWEGFVNTAKTISENFDGVIKGKITPETFRKASDALRKSAENMQTLKNASADIFKALFNSNSDMNGLQTKFEGFVDQVSLFMNKTSVVSSKVESVYETVNDVRQTFQSIDGDLDKLKDGPVETRVKIVRKILKGVGDIVQSFPDILNKSANLGSSLGLNSTWLRRFSHRLVSLTDGVNSVINTTDFVLQGVGLTAQGVTNITSLSKGLAGDFQKLLRAPLSQKFKIFEGSLKKVNQILDSASNIASTIDKTVKEVTGTNLSLSTNLAGLTNGINGFIGNVSNAFQKVYGIYKDVTSTIDAIKSGPVAKIGKLVDSTEELVKNLKNYNLAELLILSPKLAKGKIGEIKDIIGESGVILKNISNLVTKYCPSCNLEEIFGSNFVNKFTNGLQEGLDKLTGNATQFLERVSTGAQGVQEILSSVNGIKNELKRLKKIKLNTEGIRTVSDILRSSSGYLESIKNGSSDVFKALFNDDSDLNILKGKFEGLVTNLGSFLQKAGGFTDKVADAFSKADELKKTFNNIKSNFSSLKEGPLESRVKAVRNIVNGVMSITSGLPGLLNASSLGLQSTAFLRRFGTQLQDVTDGVNKVLNKTSLALEQVGQTIEGVNDVISTSKSIGQDFQRLLRAPWSEKFKIAAETVGKIKTLTEQVNNVTGSAVKVIETVTGKTISKTSIFGNATTEVLDKITNGINLVADRYEKFRELSKTVGEAFKSIKEDPVKFALEGLPKLFNQADDFIKTIVNDTKGIAEKLGINLDNISLDPKLVSAAKNFFKFAKTTLGAIQSGHQLFKDFKTLFNSKNFKDAMTNFQKLTESGKEFLNNLDKLGSSLFKEDWTKLKGKFQETLKGIGKSLGLNMEKLGDLFNKGVSVVGDVMSIASDIKALLNMKKFNLDTVVNAAKLVVNIANKATKILKTFGVNIQSKALTQASQYVGVVTAVYQIAKGISDFIKWMNDVCDITYETVITKKNLTYACLKQETKIEKYLLPVEKCTYVNTPVKVGYGAVDYCCQGEQCVFIQRPSCLEQNERCISRRKAKANSMPNVQRNLALAFVIYEKSLLTMEAAQLKMKAALYLKQRSELSLNQSIGNLRRVVSTHNRTKKAHGIMRNDLNLLNDVINKITNKSKISAKDAEFDLTLYHPSVSRVPMKLRFADARGNNQELNFMMDFNNEHQSFSLAARSLISKVTGFIPVRKKRSVAGDDNQKAVSNIKANAIKCASYKENTNTLTDILSSLDSKISRISSTASSTPQTSSTDITTSDDPSVAARQLINELKLLNKETSTGLKDALKKWKSESELKLLQDLGSVCSSLNDCFDTLLDNITDFFNPALQNYSTAITSTDQLKGFLQEITADPAPRKDRIKLLIKKSQSLLATLERSAEFCDSVPQFSSQLPSATVAYLGETLKITCDVISRFPVKYLWRKNVTVLPNQNKNVLVIKNVENDDEGQYRCEASNVIGTSISSTTFVRVFKKLRIHNKPSDVIVDATTANNVSLLCNASGGTELMYTWKFLPFNGGIVTVKSPSAILDLNSVSNSEAGLYWCEVSDGFNVVRTRKVKVSLVNAKAKKEAVVFVATVATVKTGNLANASLCQATDGNILKRAAESSLQSKLGLYSSNSSMTLNYIKNPSGVSAGRLHVELTVQQPNLHKHSDDAILTMQSANAQADLKRRMDDLIDAAAKKELTFNTGYCGWNMMLSKSSINWEADELECPGGMGTSVNRLKCVTCPPGSFDNGKRQCKSCPIGSYQSQYGQSRCIPCGNGKLTDTIGNVYTSACTQNDFKCPDDIRVMLAVDSSSQMGSVNWNKLKTFITSLINQFQTGNAATKFSLATFDDVARLQVSFESYDSKDNLLKMVKKMQYGGTSRRTDLALQLASRVFESNSLNDENSRNVLVLLSSGPATTTNVPGYILLQNPMQKLKASSFEIYNIYVGQPTPEKELLVASSSPKENTIFRIHDFDELGRAASMISHALCNG